MIFRWLLSAACAARLLTLGNWADLRWADFCRSGDSSRVEDGDDEGFFLQSGRSCGSELWSQITPSRELVYQACFDGFQCARLDLPMDWNRTDADEHRDQLAVAKLPAKVPVTDRRYGGVVWLQSGGPGESGIDFILNFGKGVQVIVDSDLGPLDMPDDSNASPKYFDILAIDSRGLNNSTPCFSYFPTLSSRESWQVRAAAEGVLGSSDIAFQDPWAMAQATGSGCSRKVTESQDARDRLALHVNTTPQISDMVAILELHGQWREREVLQRLRDERPHLSTEQSSRIIERTKWRDEEKLNFWGVSYGTVIGATFAAMHPHRVGRVVIDGVADTADNYRGEKLASLQDTDTVLERLGQHCHIAGPESCPLYTDGGAEQIVHRVRSIVESLKSNPIGVPGMGARGPQLITYSNIVQALFTSLYAPLQGFPALAEQLLDLSSGNGTSFVASTQQRLQQPIAISLDEASPYDSEECNIQRHSPGDTRTAIICSDSDSTFGMTRLDFEGYVDALRQQSRLFADSFALVRMNCVAWSLKAKWRFPGPFSANKTANPMLMVGTLADPVTPIRNAHLVSKNFPGSAVLSVDGEGHCTFSSPSLCLAHHVRRYFQTGQLPDVGIVCDADEKVFRGLTAPSPVLEKDARLLEELRQIARRWVSAPLSKQWPWVRWRHETLR